MRTILVGGIIAIALSADVFTAYGDPYWIVTWYKMESPGTFGPYLLTEVFSSFEFSENWGTGSIVSVPIRELCPSCLFGCAFGCTRENFVGFIAETAFFVNTQQKATFTVTANNGFRLFLDDDCILSSWQELVDETGVRTRTVKVTLSPRCSQVDTSLL